MNYFRKEKLDSRGFPKPPSKSRVALVLLWALAISALFVLQTNIVFWDFTLNLAVLVPFYIGLKRSPEKGMIAGAGIGLIEDSISLSITGPHILSKGIVGLLSPLLAGRFFIWTPLFGVLALFLMTFIDGFLVYAAKSIFQEPPSDMQNALLEILVQAAINAPLGFFIKPREE